MKKRIRILVTGISLCILLSACSDKKENSAIQAGGEPETTTTTTATTTVHTTTATTTTPTTTQITTQATTKKEVKTEANNNLNSGEVDNLWALFLVNQTNVLPSDFSVSTQKISGKYEIDERAADYAIKMFDAAAADGVTLRVVSAYRTIQYQQMLFDRDVKMYEGQGMTPDEAYIATSKNIAIPGQSEHNAGLAIDILSNDWWDVTEGFATTNAFKWLSENAQKYGFILRYPKGKESITGIVYEPWHYRFVGIYHANKIKESGLCLEEYMGKIEN